jgi:hypothetical protein
MRHGRKAYAYDPVSKKIINMKYIYLTAGYEPDFLKDYYPQNPDFGSGGNFNFSGYAKWVTWTYDPAAEEWEILCPCNPGLDLMVSTPRGVMAVDYYWRAVNTLDRPDTARYRGEKVVENAVYLLDVRAATWKKLSSSGPWPQNLYELTALVYDSRRDRLILHGAGPERNELWTFSFADSSWQKQQPSVSTLAGGRAPVCRREGVYLPGEDVYFTCGYPPGQYDSAGVYIYRVGENAWYEVDIQPPPGRDIRSITGQNRAITYDPGQDLVLMLLGRRGSGDLSETVIYALRYDHRKDVLKR